jgi:hypothetical protein
MSERDSEAVPEHVIRIVDAVIRRSYVAAGLDLDFDAFALPDRTLAELGLPPREGPVYRPELRVADQRRRILADSLTREVDAECSTCGQLTHYVRVGSAKAFVPSACPEHNGRPLTNWRVA